ncbi:phospholysine phosphohistidine inorganic pyrophosphate phosphatase isoform X2 [Cyanistes caeruleus]|uniref:phospholysine phosphohistidine inorganic pyrophosphate phosphatase isoform X2 n=1 Tax=Cyanistes caeruleus TaxID=156563 RepID=UPI000CDB0DEB|nr:phospholysine phosphohistidine inorganic pyrophosphate phosphatase isoform X2 [Cyanistes caeruleus]
MIAQLGSDSGAKWPWIKASGLKLQLCTNETQATRENFVRKLRAMGFDISVAEVTAPAPAACRLLKERGLRPHLLVHDDLVPEFAEIDKTNPNCVVLGDAAENFTYANLNEAFRLLIGMEKPVLISLGKGRYYKETDGLKLDVGAYMKALEYACDVQAEVVGKPAKRFFESALAELGVPPEQAIMIGDDIVNDVGGAQQCGMRALQVRTGKYRFCRDFHEGFLCSCARECSKGQVMTQSQMVHGGPSGAQGHVRTEHRSPGTAEGQNNLSAHVGELTWPYSSTFHQNTTMKLARSDHAILAWASPAELFGEEWVALWGLGFWASCCLS